MDLTTFALWCVEQVFEGCDLDGGDVQDKAVECGVLVPTRYDPAIHGENQVDAEPGDDWYVFSPEFKALLDTAK